jgi:hypothetical protein
MRIPWFMWHMKMPRPMRCGPENPCPPKRNGSARRAAVWKGRNSSGGTNSPQLGATWRTLGKDHFPGAILQTIPVLGTDSPARHRLVPWPLRHGRQCLGVDDGLVPGSRSEKLREILLRSREPAWRTARGKLRPSDVAQAEHRLHLGGWHWGWRNCGKHPAIEPFNFKCVNGRGAPAVNAIHRAS